MEEVDVVAVHQPRPALARRQIKNRKAGQHLAVFCYAHLIAAVVVHYSSISLQDSMFLNLPEESVLNESFVRRVIDSRIHI